MLVMAPVRDELPDIVQQRRREEHLAVPRAELMEDAELVEEL